MSARTDCTRYRSAPFVWLLAISAGIAPEALAGEGFAEEAVSRGVDFPIAPDVAITFGYGVAFADLDNDDDADLIALGRRPEAGGNSIGIFRNDGAGRFQEVSPASTGIPHIPLASGVTAADYDGDGDLDLYISVWLFPDHLFRNDGAMHFTDVTAAAGLGDSGAGTGCAWGDYDNDGWLDLYKSNRTGTDFPGQPPSLIRNKLYRNLGNGAFDERAAAEGVEAGEDPSFQATLSDVDLDGDVDLYLANDKGFALQCAFTNRLWENRNGAFVEISQPSGTNVCIDAMCIAVGDFDGNRWPDFYSSNTPSGNALLLNNGDRTFVEAAATHGVASYAIGWGAVFFDCENDGLTDLYLCNMVAPNRLYVHSGGWPCEDRAAAMNVADTGSSFSLAAADIDNDGDVDLAVSNLPGRILLFVNRVGEDAHWAKFRVRGTGGNVFAVGATVQVRTGAHWQMRQVLAGSGYKGQDDLKQQVGLGDAKWIDEIEVLWPGGARRTLYGRPADATWTLLPPSALRPGDLNCDGVVGNADIDAFVQALTRPADYAAEHANCDMSNGDTNGDGYVDNADIDAFVALLGG